MTLGVIQHDIHNPDTPRSKTTGIQSHDIAQLIEDLETAAKQSQMHLSHWFKNRAMCSNPGERTTTTLFTLVHIYVNKHCKEQNMIQLLSLEANSVTE